MTLSWILAGNRHQRFVAKDFSHRPGNSRMISFFNVKHFAKDYKYDWIIALFVSNDELVYLAYTVNNGKSEPIPPLPNFEFRFTVSGLLKGLNGLKWKSTQTVNGSLLPKIEKEKNEQKWTILWCATKGLVDLDPSRRPIQQFLDLRTGTLELDVNFQVWRAEADVRKEFGFSPIFNIQTLNNLPEELQTKAVDVCLVTKGGIIQAHSSKIRTEFPGLLKDVYNTPGRDGIVWALINEKFTTLLKLVKVMYDCYHDEFELEIVDLLVAAKRLNLKELYAKIIHWKLQDQRQLQ